MIGAPRDPAAFWVAASAAFVSVVPFLAVSTLSMLNLPFGVLLTSLVAFGGFGLAMAVGFQRTDALGFTRTTWRWVAVAVLLGLANLPVTTLVNAVLALWFPDDATEPTRRVLRLIVGAPDEARWVFIAGAALAAPFGEELFFRGFLQPLGRRALPEAASLVFVGAAFAAIHFQPTAFLALMELGMLFGLLRLRSGSLWPAIIMHATHNASSLALLFLADDPLAAIDAAPDWTLLLALGVPGTVATLAILWKLPAAQPVDDPAPVALRPGRMLASLSVLFVLGAGLALGLYYAGDALPGAGLKP